MTMLLRRLRRVCEGLPRGDIDSNQGLQPWSGGRFLARPPDRVVSQYLVMVQERAVEARTRAARRPGRQGLAPRLGARYLYCDRAVPWLFTENETNTERLFNV